MRTGFDADLGRLCGAIEAIPGALVTFDDGSQGIDTHVVPPALLSAYNGLVQYGYANGLMP